MNLDIATLSLDEIQEIKKQLEEEEAARFPQFKGKKILGFKLSLASCIKNNKNYQFWKAHLYYKGRMHVIHVGKDPTKAKAKIAQYRENHPELNDLAI